MRRERDRERAQLLLELRAVAMALDLVSVDVLGHRDEVRLSGRLFTRAGDA